MITNEPDDALPLSLAKRKERLTREGAAYRAAIQTARTTVSHNLHVDVLARSLVGHLKGSMFATLGGLVKLKGSNLQTLLPVALSAFSFASRLKILRPIARVGVIIGVIGLGLRFIARRKQQQASVLPPDASH